ncbi:MAG: PfaD family polyunsaturated fatty acid/polyketide biosynthesis protein, partial [Deltaproteobacteria bacterium]|nr:PfaD family polyunsaturated fatty acid/polyketide biosynthesis protein [Deltaproteobacteria bacterium]
MQDNLPLLGSWRPTRDAWAGFSPADLETAASQPRQTLHIVRHGDAGPLGVALGGSVKTGVVETSHPGASDALEWLATLPPLYPEWLGDRRFNEAHGVRFPYIAGAMANGIAGVDLVLAMARAQMLGFFGAGGLDLPTVRDAVTQIQSALHDESGRGGPAGLSWGSNLIHSPQDPALEAAVADLYIERGVRRVSASAYMKLTPPLVRLAATGLRELPDGQIARRHHLFAKISRPEVAALFCAPPPEAILDHLVAEGQITASEARLARRIPVATDLTAEADSGGHTDNRPLGALLPTILAVRDAAAERLPSAPAPRVGAAGGLGTPRAVAAAFAAGAAYVVTGSINQACVEAKVSPDAKRLLADAGIADVVMAPAPDMFELGVKVQVLRRGTLFAQRAAQLFNIYRAKPSLEAIDGAQRQRLEEEIFQAPLGEVWQNTRAFFAARAPDEVTRAEADPKHRMALVFRWYVGKSSRWAIAGDPARRLDYQIWCGPAMGAFSSWVRGSFLEELDHRDAVQVALNLLEGATVITRAQTLRAAGLPVPDGAFRFHPGPLAASVVPDR